ncbi:hypothetical protein GPL02_08970 [Clostridium sp. MCC334]|nr:hypothetical protein [Clostridium sp. MCC334]
MSERTRPDGSRRTEIVVKKGYYGFKEKN